MVLRCKDQKASGMAQQIKLLSDPKDPAFLQKCELEEWSGSEFVPLSVPPRHGDVFVCCVLSHGQENVVLGVDGEPLPIREITSAFSHCSALLRKPKLFFIQACQEESLQPGLGMEDHVPVRDALDPEQLKEEDSPPGDLVEEEDDILVAMATVGKHIAVRHEVHGSLFIQSLCKQLRKGCRRYFRL